MPTRTALLCVVLAGCASAPVQRDKGGLVPVRVETGALDSAFRARRFALLIGVDRTDDEGFRALRFAAKDAKDLAAALSDPQVGHFDGVTVLTAPKDTTRASVLSALQHLASVATRPDDIVLVYVSAHGTLARDDQGVLRRYLVTSDAQLRKVEQTALSMELLEAAFKTLPSRRRLLVLATCHSGSGKSLLPKDVEAELASVKSGFFAAPLEEASRASVVLSASDWGETAREDDGLQNDIYTHFLVEALVSGDRNLDGAVTATEAHDFARRKTYAFTKGRQRPSAEILEVGADPIVLAGSVRRLGNPEVFSYSSRLDGFTLVVDGAASVELPGGAAVTPGMRHLQLSKGGAPLLDEDVIVSEGERIELDTLLRRSQPRRSVSLGGGAFGFADAQSRSTLLPVVPTANLAFRYERPYDAPVALRLGLSGSAGTRTLLSSAPFGYQLLSLSAGADLLWARRWLQLFGGPEVAALWLRRSFALETYMAAQDVLTVMPGLSLGAAVVFLEHWEVSLRAQLMLAFMAVDGTGRALGFAGGSAALGYRF
nr:hypothetical protein Hi04_10k_c3807_00013 [uncultured bacterium]